MVDWDGLKVIKGFFVVLFNAPFFWTPQIQLSPRPLINCYTFAPHPKFNQVLDQQSILLLEALSPMC